MDSSNASTTLLVAEDDDEDYLVVLESLQGSGLFGWLRRVKDGEELLEALHDGTPPPSLILLDLNMPRMDGREALRRIRGEGSLRGIPIAVLTSSEAEADVVRAYGLGVEYFVRKPVEFDQILDIIRAVEAVRRASEGAAHGS